MTVLTRFESMDDFPRVLPPPGQATAGNRRRTDGRHPPTGV